MRLSMPDTPAQGSGKARRRQLRPALLLLFAALGVAVAAGVALRRSGDNGPAPDALPSLSGTEAPAGAAEEGDAGVPPPVVVRGTGTPVPVSAPAPGVDTDASWNKEGVTVPDSARAPGVDTSMPGTPLFPGLPEHAPGADAPEQDAGARERIFRLAEEEAERLLQEAAAQEAAAAIAYRRAVAGAARGKAGAAEPAEAEAALERARALVRAVRRDFEAASLKRAEAGAEARRAAGTAGAGFPGRSMPRRAAAGQEHGAMPPLVLPPDQPEMK
jgi:hypothetical protein